MLIFFIFLTYTSFGGIDDVYKRQFTFDFALILRIFVSVFFTAFFALKLILARRAIYKLILDHSTFFFYALTALVAALINYSPLQSYYFTATLFYPFFVVGWLNHISATSDSLIEKTMLGFISWFSLLFISTVLSILVDPVESLRLNSDFRLRSNLISVGSNGLSWISLLFILMIFLVRPIFDFRFILSVLAPVVFIFLTQSRTTFVIIIFLAIYSVYAKGRRRSLSQYFSVVSIVLLSVILSIGFTQELVLGFTRGETQFASLSGRTLIWEYMLQGFLLKPWLGWGLWNGVNQLLSGTQFEFISGVHSSVVEVIVSTGIVGFIFWSAYFSNLFLSFRFKLTRIDDRFTRRRVLVLRLLGIAYLGKIFTSSEMIYADPSFFILVALIFINKRIFAELSYRQSLRWARTG